MERGLIQFCGKQFENNGEKCLIWRTSRNLALVYVIERPVTVHNKDSDKGTVFEDVFTDRPSIDILYYPGERDDKRELIKAGHYMLLRRSALLSLPENENVYSLGDYVAVCSETTDWFMCVISEIDDPSKEVKVRLTRKSGQFFLLSKKLEKWFPKSAIFHRSSMPFIDNRMRYSFDVINIKGICDKIKTVYRDFKMDLHICKSQLK